MKLTFTPLSRNALPMPESVGTIEDARAHAANILRSARARGERPRRAGPNGLWRLSNGLLRLCF